MIKTQTIFNRVNDILKDQCLSQQNKHYYTLFSGSYSQQSHHQLFLSMYTEEFMILLDSTIPLTRINIRYDRIFYGYYDIIGVNDVQISS